MLEFAGRARTSGLALTATAGKLLGHIAKRSVPQLAHGFGGQSPFPVRVTVQEALSYQRPLQFGQRPGIDSGLVAELTGQSVEVDVIHGGPGIALRQLLGQLLELGDIGQRLGTLPHAQRVAA